VQAAGGVVYRRVAEGLEVVVVHRPRYDDWSLPKGKVEPGEEEAVTALREILEETSLSCRAEAELDPVEYTDDRGRPKRVRYWLMQPIAGSEDARPGDEEVDEVHWMLVERAMARLSYALDRGVLGDALALLEEA
jgi:8-oxo-dGTP diphosphatase